MQRHARARQLLDRMAQRVTVEALARLLRDKKGVDDKEIGYGNRNAIDGLIASHGVIMDVTAGKMWVAAWPYVEGKFIGVDVMAMLDRGVAGDANSTIDLPVTPIWVGEDSMMETRGEAGASMWARVERSRAAMKAAVAAYKEGQYQKAGKLADELVRDNPNFYMGHELKGSVLLQGGDKSGAKAEFTRALELDPPYLKRRQALEGLMRQCEIP